MNDAPRKMALTLYNAPSGISIGSWRRDGSTSDSILTLKLFADIAIQCERAGLDAFFLADNVSTGPNDFRQALNYPLEPMTVLGALSAVTSKIGLIATGSTSYIEPYNLARFMATIDQLSDGRAGWNIVTSVSGAHNFSAPSLDHDERYQQAHEYMEVVTQLWDSWQDDAIVDDKAAGMWADPTRIHHINFEGDYYKVAGPMNIPRSPQGWPVFAQAGSSPAGLGLAVQWADIIFTPQPTLEGAQQFYSEVRERATSAGRDPNGMRVLPGFVPIIGETEHEAKQLANDLLDLIDYDAARADLQRFIAPVDISDLELDEPIPAERLIPPDQVQTGRTKYAQFYEPAAAGAPLRDLVRIKASLNDHAHVTGTVEQAADLMEQYFTQGASDGFMIIPSYMPGGLDAITERLVPELRDRGLFEPEYVGTTFREHLGLARPSGLKV